MANHIMVRVLALSKQSKAFMKLGNVIIYFTSFQKTARNNWSA